MLLKRRNSFHDADGFFSTRVRMADVELCPLIRGLTDQDAYLDHLDNTGTEPWYEMAMQPKFHDIPERLLRMQGALSMIVGDREIFTQHRIYEFIREEFGPRVTDIYRKFCQKPIDQAEFASAYLTSG